MPLVIDLIGQRSRDLIGRCQLSPEVIGCEDSIFNKTVYCLSVSLIQLQLQLY